MIYNLKQLRMKKITLITILIIAFAQITFAQNTIAKLKFEEAEEAYAADNFELVLEKLKLKIQRPCSL